MLGLSPKEFERRTAAAARQVQGEARGCVPRRGPRISRQGTARPLPAAMSRADAPRRPVRSERRHEVMQRLGEKRDTQIAAELGLSAYGVRQLLARLGAQERRRRSAVRG